ncbi:hypothetical protein H112_06022 [Trichophyton rubrum D6]|uniref:Uncharacterized protein n=1 Tax=Trichophyton rubrum CBS 288.86 TaxID=1215330 RepID=A0A022VX30_TRIRU|nr:hypothetical protein H100_06036 [Trichophyton rubrum MR850]EZF39970.1 hypothetical protein H102_06005 [Trichophyton rubrum CBS 100081]EZF50610.1 hypothetical protein H103_06030 [Trichophyton rubrum CBS 288.86]EZF61154.1 hypothetical protein H104_06018 [Trichophyton rubrum CBS 289.86]EZF82370.1 hypothetical protein H110_06026 [Trichophyton rubrum MR1448]EZG04195.1 hypothetical protein H106_05867 [Trichophyton rubrum CBS 735.88]EZG14722.1 hypothetical protein H107_06167 [Trichophyton rubrum 
MTSPRARHKTPKEKRPKLKGPDTTTTTSSAPKRSYYDQNLKGRKESLAIRTRDKVLRGKEESLNELLSKFYNEFGQITAPGAWLDKNPYNEAFFDDLEDWMSK